MLRTIRLTLLSALLLAGVAQAATPAAPNADRVHQLFNELAEAQKRGDTARIQAITAELQTIASQKADEQKAVLDAAKQQAPELQKKMQSQADALLSLAESPEWKLSLAARRGDLAEVKRLRQAGAQLNLYRIDPAPPLMEAAKAGHVEVAQYLLDEGAQMRIVKGMVTLDALRLAAEAREDNSAMLKLLVARGAMKAGNVETIASAMMKEEEKKGGRGPGISANQITAGSALTAAVEKGRVAHVKTLLSLGANANDWAHGRSALMIAARQLNPQIVQVLLEHGADRALTGQDRKTALQLAEETRETPQNAERRKAVIDLLRRS